MVILAGRFLAGRLLGLAAGRPMVILAGRFLAGRFLGRRLFGLIGRRLVSLGRHCFGDRIHWIIEGKQKVGHRH
jgi:hypothetical protein